ncbi:glycosyltransferase [Seleniivibrio sp.]|uniref:glycosyltransferase n=1 Tax=Seleniivibrio sp. TaxID=2898801 RepID=UPI00341B4F84|nr:glycosyltransferase [Seleniivibrio sp.]
MKYNITVLIVYYDTDLSVFADTMRSLLNRECISKIYIINNSDTDLHDYSENERIEIINTERNIGFGGGHNIVIRDRYDIISEYHIICNPDVYFEHDVPEQLAEYMDRHPEAGLIVPKVLSVNGENQYAAKLLPTPFDLIIRMFHQYLPEKLVNRYNKRYELQSYDKDESIRTANLSGCFMFLRKTAIKKAGYFDERFFVFMEDVDFSRRFNSFEGSYYVPSIFIYHHRGRGSYKYMRQRMIHISSAIKYFNKWGWLFDRERRNINSSLRKILAI